MKQWKLSAMDLESRIRWEDYTRAKEDMFAKTNIPEAPWYIVEGNDKKRERLNCMNTSFRKYRIARSNMKRSICQNVCLIQITNAAFFLTNYMSLRSIKFLSVFKRFGV